VFFYVCSRAQRAALRESPSTEVAEQLPVWYICRSVAGNLSVVGDEKFSTVSSQMLLPSLHPHNGQKLGWKDA
jgi:hypothetical protein